MQNARIRNNSIEGQVRIVCQRDVLLPTHSVSDPQGRICLIESSAKSNNQQKIQEQAVTIKTEEKKQGMMKLRPLT